MEVSTFSNDFADLCGPSSSARSLGPYRLTTATGHRPPKSLVLPSSTREMCVEEANKADTAVSIEHPPVKLIEDEKEEEEMPVLCWCVYEIVRLLCWTFCATLVAIFAFMWIFYAFDVYWLARAASNDSSVTWGNGTMPSLIEEATIDYDDQY